MVQRTQVILEGNTISYGRVLSPTHKDTCERFKDMLREAGITKVINNSQALVSINELMYGDVTIAINPKIDYPKVGNAVSFVEIFGEKYVLAPCYENFVDNNVTNIIVQDKVVGQYYENRNLIILYFNPFLLDPKRRKFNRVIDSILINNETYERFDNTEFVTNNFLKLNASQFVTSLKKQYDGIDNTIKQISQNIHINEKSIIEGHKDIRVKLLYKESVSKMIDNFEVEFEKNIKEANELGFVKNITVTKIGVEIDYGLIEIIHENYKYTIGHMVAIIHPNKVTFKRIGMKKQESMHPHIYTDGGACFSSYHKDVNELLGKLQLKRLAILLSQFLRSYNPKSPVHNISNFKRTKVVKNPNEPKLPELPKIIAPIELSEILRPRAGPAGIDIRSFTTPQ